MIYRVSAVYETGYANVHRGLHYLSEKATADYEAARETIRGYINAKSTAEIVCTRGATEAINLVPPPGAARTCAKATRSSSPTWSIIRTSCRGSFCGTSWA